MKQKLLYSLRLRACMLLALLCAGFTSAWAEEVTKSVTLADGSFETDHITWTLDDVVTITQTKGNSATAVNSSYISAPRFYKGHVILFEATSGITLNSIVISGPTGTGDNSISKFGENEGWIINSTDGTATWTGSASSISITANAQVRPTGITITYSTSGGTVTPTCATPTFSPAAGAVFAGTEVSINCSTTGASIYYTTNGQEPSASEGTLYEDPIEINEATTIKAIAVKDGAEDSEVATAEYTIKQAISGLNIDFESDLDCYVDWVFDNIGNSNSTIEAHDGEKYGANMNDSGNGVAAASITTKDKVANPTTFTCYVSKTSTNSTSSTWFVEVSTDGSSWNEVKSLSATSMEKGAWTEVNANLGSYKNVYVRLRYDGSTAMRAVDDISIVEGGKMTATVTIDKTSLNISETATVTTDGPAVTLTTSHANIASVSGNTVTAVAAGTATITATWAENDEYEAGSQEFTVTVTDPNAPGSINNPYTVAQARAAIDAGTGLTNVYAKGIVSEIVTAYNSQYGNITYNISADGSTTSDQLQAYRGKSYNGADFTSEDDIQVGDEVVVYGTLKKYEDTYEFEAGNQLVSLKRKKSDATILVGDASVVYGTTFTIDTEVIKGGEITVTSGNTAIATVSGLTITPVAVGSVEITVTTAENDYYKAGSETFTLTITQPEGQTTASTGSEGGIVFYESFAGSTGSITTFSNTDGNGEIKYDNDGWLVTNAYGADDAAKFGSSKKTGSAETPNITGTIGATYTMTFKAAPWASEETTMKVSATGATISGISETSMTTGQWNEFTATVTPTATTFSVTFEASKNRFFLDEVKIEAPAASAPAITAKLNASGYATYCNQYPLSFANNENVTAWALTGIEKDGDGTYKMNYTQITGAVKGGVGMLLKGEANDEVEIESKNSEDTPTTNLFVGTLAPTYVEAGAVYGLSGSTFKKSASNGTVKANKAYIPASELPADAKSFIFVFENETTGIRTMETHSAEEVKAIFNIAGQRLQNMQKGINIVGGKKILVK